MKNAEKFSWDEYFSGTTRIDKTQNGSEFYNTTGSNNFYVFLCFFEFCNEKGAIYITRSNDIRTLLEESSFNSCSSTSSGGSVYYFCYQAGQFVQQRNYYYKSIAANSYMSFYQRVKPSSSNKNYAFEVSISKCGESESKGYITFEVDYGDIRFSNNNITNNKCSQKSSYYSVLQGSSGECKLSTFRENHQTSSESLRFGSNSNPLIQTVSYCNIIGNKCGTNNNNVIFLGRYTTNVDHCIFLCNTAVYMFRCQDQGYTLTISDSYVQSQTTTGPGTVTFSNLKNKYDFNILSDLNAEICIENIKDLSIKLFYHSKFSKISATNLLS